LVSEEVTMVSHGYDYFVTAFENQITFYKLVKNEESGETEFEKEEDVVEIDAAVKDIAMSKDELIVIDEEN